MNIYYYSLELQKETSWREKKTDFILGGRAFIFSKQYIQNGDDKLVPSEFVFSICIFACTESSIKASFRKNI